MFLVLLLAVKTSLSNTVTLGFFWQIQCRKRGSSSLIQVNRYGKYHLVSTTTVSVASRVLYL